MDTILAGCTDGGIYSWNFPNMLTGIKYNGHTKTVTQIHKMTSSLFISCGDDESIMLWETNKSQPVKKFDSEHTRMITCLEKIDEEKFLSGS